MTNPTTGWRIALHDHILDPLRTFVDANLQAVRVTTILSFAVVSVLTVRQMKGVRRYTSALQVPPNVYGDIIRCRLARTSPFQMEHRPLFGTFIRQVVFLGADSDSDSNSNNNKTNNTIQMRPYGVVLLNDHSTTSQSWLTQALITPRTTIQVMPVYLDDETSVVSHMYARIYHGRSFWSPYVKKKTNLSLALVELGLARTAVEEGAVHDVEFMQLLEQAERRARRERVGVWAERSKQDEEDSGAGGGNTNTTGWRRWLGI